MKKQIDGYCAIHKDGHWDAITFDENLKETEKLTIGNFADAENDWQIKPARLVDVSDDSKDVVVPRELLETIHIFLKADPKDIDPDEHAAWRKNYSLFLVNKLSEILSEKHDDD